MKMNTVDMAPSFQARTATVENVNHECFDGWSLRIDENYHYVRKFLRDVKMQFFFSRPPKEACLYKTGTGLVTQQEVQIRGGAGYAARAWLPLDAWCRHINCEGRVKFGTDLSLMSELFEGRRPHSSSFILLVFSSERQPASSGMKWSWIVRSTVQQMDEPTVATNQRLGSNCPWLLLESCQNSESIFFQNPPFCLFLLFFFAEAVQNVYATG